MSGQPLIILLAHARELGVSLRRAESGKLNVRGSTEAAPIVRALIERKTEVFELLPLYRGEVKALDWSRADMGELEPCLLCGRPALCREPYDGHPCHKVCVEARLGHRTNAQPPTRQGT